MDKQNEKQIDQQIKSAFIDLDAEAMEDLLKLAKHLETENRDKESDIMHLMDKTGIICR